MYSYDSGNAYLAGSLFQNCDERSKKNIRDIDDKEALNKLLLIEPERTDRRTDSFSLVDFQNSSNFGNRNVAYGHFCCEWKTILYQEPKALGF